MLKQRDEGNGTRIRKMMVVEETFVNMVIIENKKVPVVAEFWERVGETYVGKTEDQ